MHHMESLIQTITFNPCTNCVVVTEVEKELEKSSVKAVKRPPPMMPKKRAAAAAASSTNTDDSPKPNAGE